MTPTKAPGALIGGDNDSASQRDAARWRLLRNGAAGAFLVQVAGAGLGLIVHAIIARMLGPSGYGTYALALTWVSLLCVVGLAGQSTAVVRFIPPYVQNAQWAELCGLRRRVRQIVLAASIIVTFMGSVIVYLLRALLTQELQITLYVAFFLLPALTQLHLSGALLRALKRSASSGAFNNLLRPVLLLALVLTFALILDRPLTAPLAMLASGLGAVGALFGSEWFLTRAWPVEATWTTPSYLTPAWITLGLRFLLLGVIGIVLNRVDVLILGALGGASDVGPYYAAVQIAGLATYGINAVETPLAPMISESYAAGNHHALAKLVNRAAWLSFTVTIIIALTAALTGHWVLTLFGQGFSVAYLPLLVILTGQCLAAAVGPVGFLVTMTRFDRQSPVLFGGGAFINIVFSLLLIPDLGILGAALATATSSVLWKLWMLAFVRKKLGINASIFFGT